MVRPTNRLTTTGLALMAAGWMAFWPAEPQADPEAPTAPGPKGQEVAEGPFVRDSAAPVDETLGLRLPAGFTATVFADDLGRARHIAVAPDGTVYVNLRVADDNGHGVVALQDRDADGAADVVERFGAHTGSGIAVQDGFLYVASDIAVHRYARKEGELTPSGAQETIVEGFPDQRSHAAKALAFDGAGALYVNQGVPSNACQAETRTPGSPGRQPCDELEFTGIWKFEAATAGQDQLKDGEQIVRGIRHAFAMDWHPGGRALFFTMHGRDQLNTLWPDHFDTEDNAEMPAEEFHMASSEREYGWPFTFVDPRTGRRLVAPEYGGDGSMQAEPGRYADPIIAFPAHWAPNGMEIYTGDAFPQAMQGGAFVAFHGSWNRAPLPQGGYLVAFLPFKDGRPTGEWGVFADGFAGAEVLASPRDARFRPMGVAQGPDGALYIGDTLKGRIWRVTYAAP